MIAVLIFGARKGALVTTVGLGLFDIFNGYAAEVWITIFRIFDCLLCSLSCFEKLLKSNDKIANIIIIGSHSAMIKIILNFIKYTIINSVVAALPLNAAMVLALTKINWNLWNISSDNHCGSLSSILSSNVFYRETKDLAGRSLLFLYFPEVSPNFH
ncbi:MAG: hypothetical protein ACLR70_04790 [Streptococcus thermophilus]